MTQQSREDRRAKLAQAVWEIIATHGISAVSVRTVAAEAGMAVGSLRHLFPTQAQLLEFSAELMIQRATERIGQTPPCDDPLEYALDVIKHVLPLTPESRREFEINLALIAETPAHPNLARTRDLAHEALLDLFTRIVGSLRSESMPGSESDEYLAIRLLALADGLGLHLIHRPPEADTQWAVDIIRRELSGLR